MLIISPLKLNQKRLSTISSSLFFAWILSFPFEGGILYSLADHAEIDPTRLVLLVVFFHFMGLFVTGFFIKKQLAAKVTMIGATVVCIAGSLIFYLPFSVLWYISIIAIAFFAGLFVASWGFYFKNYSELKFRLKTAADVLIISNIIMIITNVLAVTISAFLALSLAILTLLGSLAVTLRLENSPNKNNKPQINSDSLSQEYSYIKPFVFLCAFVVVITINSGLMYQVFNPAFAQYELLSSYYWAVPYIVALLILRNLSIKTSQAYILYIAMIMIGISYILFMWLDRTIISYLIIDTLMLGAFGVCDLFWWSIFGSFFEYAENPAKILGVGLSMNVLGILIGDLIGTKIIFTKNDYFTISVIALIVIFIVMILLPILNVLLTRLLNNHTFLIKFASMEDKEQDKALIDFKYNKHLTEKETEVVKLLLRGYTYKAIAENLFISENTLKYHVKNIYQKLHVNNKMDLIKMFSEKEKI